MAVKTLPFNPKVVTDVSSNEWDAIVVVAKEPNDIPKSLQFLIPPLLKQLAVRSPGCVLYSVTLRDHLRSTSLDRRRREESGLRYRAGGRGSRCKKTGKLAGICMSAVGRDGVPIGRHGV